MEQYERLWQYQQVDMELDQYEKEMRGNSNRKELLKHRDFLLEQQNVLKKIEADVEIMGDRMEALADEIERLNGSVAEAAANFEANRPEDLEEAKKQIAALQKLPDTGVGGVFEFSDGHVPAAENPDGLIRLLLRNAEFHGLSHAVIQIRG